MLKELLKMLAKLLERGHASLEEKAMANMLFSKLSKAQQKEAKEDTEAVDDLPEEKAGEEGGEEEEEEEEGDEKPEGAEEEEEEAGEEGEDEEKKTSKIISKMVEKGVEAGVKKAKIGMEVGYKKAIKEHKDLMTKRAGLYNPSVRKGIDRVAANVRIRKYIGALIVGDNQELKEMIANDSGLSKKDMSTTDANGGYTIDSELNAEVQHLMTEYGVARREMFNVTLSKGDLKLNNLTTDVSVTWTDEAADKTSTEAVIGQVTLALKKIAAIVPLTEELLEDTEIDMFGFLAERFAEKMAEKEDLAFFKGDGTSTYGSFTGLLNNTDINEVTMTGSTFASIDVDDLMDMEDATPSGAIKDAKYYLNRTIRTFIRKLKDDNGAYIYSPAASGEPATINGYPFVIVEAMPTKADTAAETSFVLFGSMKKCAWFGTKGAMKVKIADQATVRNTADNADLDLFMQDMVALRVVERVGYVVVLATAMTKLTTAASSA